eukprot:jgi/Mesvir1/29700/Mv00933-RA.1
MCLCYDDNMCRNIVRRHANCKKLLELINDLNRTLSLSTFCRHHRAWFILYHHHHHISSSYTTAYGHTPIVLQVHLKPLASAEKRLLADANDALAEAFRAVSISGAAGVAGSSGGHPGIPELTSGAGGGTHANVRGRGRKGRSKGGRGRGAAGASAAVGDNRGSVAVSSIQHEGASSSRSAGEAAVSSNQGASTCKGADQPASSAGKRPPAQLKVTCQAILGDTCGCELVDDVAHFRGVLLGLPEAFAEAIAAWDPSPREGPPWHPSYCPWCPARAIYLRLSSVDALGLVPSWLKSLDALALVCEKGHLVAWRRDTLRRDRDDVDDGHDYGSGGRDYRNWHGYDSIFDYDECREYNCESW